MLWFLKKLKRADAFIEDLIYYYHAVIRAALEHACPTWHSSLTKRQTKPVEDALQITNNNISYEEACYSLNTTLLADLCQTLFTQSVREKTHVLHCLLAPKRDTQ